VFGECETKAFFRRIEFYDEEHDRALVDTAWLSLLTALIVGESLRGKIDEGLSHSRYGIVVLSPNFFVKTWPQQELDGLVSKEVSGIKVIAAGLAQH
jgi:hypothetical protein